MENNSKDINEFFNNFIDVNNSHFEEFNLNNENMATNFVINYNLGAESMANSLEYTNSSSLEQSGLITPINSRKDIYQCDFCEKVFQSKYGLKSHKNSHNNIKNYQCEKCGNQFLRKHDLNRHYKIHLSNHLFHCKKCNLNFNRIDSLKRHKVTKKCINNHKN